MSIFVVVPVKSLLRSKTRLSIALNPQEREALTLSMLEDVLKALTSSIVNQVCVVSSDEKVRVLANEFGARYLEENQQGLNHAINQSTEWCILNDAESVCVLPADIPLIKGEDISRIVKLTSEESSIVISPSEDAGTNALLQKPPNLIPACFGVHSFTKYVQKATARGIPIKFYCSKSVSLDIDSIEDLISFLKIKSQTTTRRFLEQIRVRRLVNL